MGYDYDFTALGELFYMFVLCYGGDENVNYGLIMMVE